MKVYILFLYLHEYTHDYHLNGLVDVAKAVRIKSTFYTLYPIDKKHLLIINIC